MNVTIEVSYAPGELSEAGLTLLADAVTLITADPDVEAALAVARQLAQTTFQQQAHQRLLERQASELRTVLDAIEEKLRTAA